MAVYDLAHAFAKALRESEEYLEYQEVRKKILENPKTCKMIQDHQNLAWLVHTSKLMGQEIKPEDQERFEKLEDLIDLNDLAKKYINAENRLGIILQDAQKIMMGSIEIGFPQEDGEA